MVTQYSQLETTPWMSQLGDQAREFMPEPGQPRLNFGIISLYDIENNAARILAACARKAGYRAIEIYFKDWVNNHLDNPRPIEFANVVRLIKKYNLQLVGLSVRASAYHKVAAAVTAYIRRFCPEVTILWGGTHAVLEPEKCIKEADLVCRGEAEITIVQLLDRLSSGHDCDNLPNVWVRRGQEIFRSPVGPTVQELDSLPFRDYASPDKFFIMGRSVTKSDPMVNDSCFQMMNSRGCVFHCSYCYNSELSELYKGQGRYYRTRSVNSVIAEIKEARRVFTNMKRIRFDDEVFLFSDEWYDEFARRYREEVGLPFEVFIEPKLVRRELFEKLCSCGLEVVYMGIQSSGRVNDELFDRSGSDQQLLQCAELFAELGIDARYHVMLDDTESTWDDKRHLFDLLMSFPRGKFQLYLFSIVIFPNTELARRLLAEGKIHPGDLEGERNKTFQQMRVSLNYPRPPEDLFWAAMFVLITKDFLSKRFLYRLADSTFMRQHPRLLAWFAQICNIIKMLGVVGRMTLNGEMNFTLLRRWSNLNSLITQ